MTRLTLALAISAGTTVSATVWVILRPPRRLRSRIGPYVQVIRTRLLRGADPETYLIVSQTPAKLRDAFEPLLERLSRLLSRVLGPRDEEQLALRLRQSGLYPGMEATDRLRAFRNRSLATAGAVAVALGAVGWQSQGGVGLVVYAIGGFTLGSFLARGRVDRAIAERRQRIRAELYTVNQILAMRARVGGGVVMRSVISLSEGGASSSPRYRRFSVWCGPAPPPPRPSGEPPPTPLNPRRHVFTTPSPSARSEA